MLAKFEALAGFISDDYIRLSNHETPLLCHNAIALHALCFFIVFKGCLMLFKGRAGLRVSVGYPAQRVPSAEMETKSGRSR